MPRPDPNAEDWRVVVRAERGAVPVMSGNEAQCRAVARSIVGMSVNDGAGVSLGRVIEARAEAVPVGEAS